MRRTSQSGKLLGIVSEGDMLRRVESYTLRHRSWWLQLLTADTTLRHEFVKSHSHKVVDVMTPEVLTVSPETPLGEIASVLEKNAIKRVPVVKDGKLVGTFSALHDSPKKWIYDRIGAMTATKVDPDTAK